MAAIDFVDRFIHKNIKVSSSFFNTTHHIGNMMDVDIENDSFDFIFVNWLLMYLRDDDARVLCDRIEKWLKPEGELFLRESCVSASNPNRPNSHAHYRDPEFYEDLFIQKFSLLSKGNVVIYEQRYGNSNQRWWLFKKIRFN